MATFATPTELAVYLQTATEAEAAAGDPNVLDTVVAMQALESASAKIRAAAGWSITEETVTRTVPYGDPVFLPSLAVKNITVTVGGTTPLADGYWFHDGVAIHFAPYWSFGPVTITYTSGYATVPDSIRDLCLEIAADRYEGTDRTVSGTFGNVTEVYSSGPTNILPPDLRTDPRLAPYVLTVLA